MKPHNKTFLLFLVAAVVAVPVLLGTLYKGEGKRTVRQMGGGRALQIERASLTGDSDHPDEQREDGLHKPDGYVSDPTGASDLPEESHEVECNEGLNGSGRAIRVTQISEHAQEELKLARDEARDRTRRTAAGMTAQDITALQKEAEQAYERLKAEMLVQRYNAGIVDLYTAAYNDNGDLEGPASNEMPEGQGPLAKMWFPSDDPDVVEVAFLPYAGYREVYEHMWMAWDLSDMLKE